MLTPPYGVFFIPPPGWEDVTYYRFRQVTEKRDFVIEEQEWDQGDPEGWLVRARERLQQLGVSPIVSAPHSEFVVRGFCRLGQATCTEPTLWLLTLSYDGQFRTLAVSGPTSEADLATLLASLSRPKSDGSSSGWLARGICVALSAAQEPPQRFAYQSSAARLSITWEETLEFAPIDLSFLPVESDVIRDAPPTAYDVAKHDLTPEFGSGEPNSGNETVPPAMVGPTSSGANALTGLGWHAPRYGQHSRTVGIVTVRHLVAKRLGLGEHCFVAQAIFVPSSMQASSRPLRVLHVSCSGDCRQEPSMPTVWRDILTLTRPRTE